MRERREAGIEEEKGWYDEYRKCIKTKSLRDNGFSVRSQIDSARSNDVLIIIGSHKTIPINKHNSSLRSYRRDQTRTILQISTTSTTRLVRYRADHEWTEHGIN